MSPEELFTKHEQTLQGALKALTDRSYWTPYPEVPSGKVYGETAKDDAIAAFKAQLNNPFALDQPGSHGTIGKEQSPYGFDLGIQYPKPDIAELIDAGERALESWKRATPEERTGVCLEILHQLNRRSFDIAFAIMHTTGQGLMMAFQAGGPHAQDRGLEAIAIAYEEMKRTPPHAHWAKQVSKTDTVKLSKTYRIVPRGVAVVIGCSTFPTWNGYPGLFASLATGNAVIVKPHPGAILPLALSVRIARDVIERAGFDANLVTLAADEAEAPITSDLVTHPRVRIVDYTGSSEFGNWIEEHATQAVVYTEKAGVNSLIIDSVENLKGMTGNIAFSLCLYSGQMCTTPQNIFIPRDVVEVEGGQMSFEEMAGAIVKAVNWFLSDPARAQEVLGAIQNPRTAERIAKATTEGGKVLRESGVLKHDQFPNARIHTPLIIQVDASDTRLYMREMFGPVVYLIATDDTEQSIELAARCAKECGAITCGIYSTSDEVIERAEEATAEAGVPLSVNLLGPIYVNQAAAFSDFHVSGCNPAGNATLCNSAFIAGRFNIVQSRHLVGIESKQPVGA